MSPQASDELRDRWGISTTLALDALADERWTCEEFVFQPREGVVPTENELSAIDFLVHEWDYGYSSRPLP
jgi:hypothetical protein